MKVYTDDRKVELVADISWDRLSQLLLWDNIKCINEETKTVSIPIAVGGCDEMFDILVAASYDFDTDFGDMCADIVELWISFDDGSYCLYVYDGVSDDVWGYVELENNEFFEIVNTIYGIMKGGD